MTRQEAEQTAFELMATGYNCAESMLRTAVAHMGIAAEGVMLRMATCFGGGVGRSHEELCGALSGGIMALGLAYGRDAVEASPHAGLDLAAAFRNRFRQRFGASCCREVLDRLGPQENRAACKRLVADAAGLLHTLLDEQRAKDGR
jgi:C_GCAxxG_C_C family probable redox protein